jgi:anti-anti-sigma factor
LDFSIERSVEPDGTVRLVLHGEADIAARGRLRAALRRESAAQTAVLVVLYQLDYLDSACVGELMEPCQRARAAGRRFAVTPGSGHVRHVLWISGSSITCAIRRSTRRRSPGGDGPETRDGPA